LAKSTAAKKEQTEGKAVVSLLRRQPIIQWRTAMAHALEREQVFGREIRIILVELRQNLNGRLRQAGSSEGSHAE
jgi:hypothetical protein